MSKLKREGIIGEEHKGKKKAGKAKTQGNNEPEPKGKKKGQCRLKR